MVSTIYYTITYICSHTSQLSQHIIGVPSSGLSHNGHIYTSGPPPAALVVLALKLLVTNIDDDALIVNNKSLFCCMII